MTRIWKAAQIISGRYGCTVLCKGGHNLNDANDLLYMNGEKHWFMDAESIIPTPHGTGCTLSSAIASNLAKGMELTAAVERAKNISPALWQICWIWAGDRTSMNHLV